MPVHRAPRLRTPLEGAKRPLSEREATIEGTFQSPTGRVGVMSGRLRLERFVAEADRLCAAGVFTGELYDADGTRIGVGSCRRSAPAEIRRGTEGTAAAIGPVDVQLLGLTVSVPVFTIGIRAAVPVTSPDGAADPDARARRRDPR